LADKIVPRETPELIMEKLTSCPVCGKPDFSPFLQVGDFFLSQEEFTIVRCDSCSFKFVNPRPDVQEISKYYESRDYVSHDSGKRNPITFLYRIIRKWSIKKKYDLVNNLSTGKKILDIGCGTGEFILYCKRNGFEVQGIEPGMKPRSFAQKEYELDVHEEEYLENKLTPEFDIITLWHVLEHVHPLNERMKKIAAILKPGGTIIIAVPNCDSWDAGHYGKYWAAYDVPRHLYHFSQENMQLLSKNHQLKILKVLPMKLDSFYISLLSEKYATGKQKYFNAVINGIRSNNFAKRNKNNYSSLIYVLKKDKAVNGDL
jgi:2-polyprenyl-3-methyl-5-hydroxy-6-metoxy-1,4-benzoquinol methylase